MKEIIRKYITAYENINISSLNDLLDCIDESFVFSDPFHSINDKNEYKKLLINMFRNIVNPKFVIMNIAQNKDVFFIKWKFTGMYKKEFSFEGMSEVLIKNNLIVKHIDYWDSGRNFYSNLPIVGKIFKKFHK